MCQDCQPVGGWTRRDFLGVAASAALVRPTSVRAAPGRAARLDVLPREAWAAGELPPGPLPPEPDVRFLVVHHTVHDNVYGEADVIWMLRGIHAVHTGPDKGWPDIAYNFVVDRFGRIWETRAGSLAALEGAPAVAGDATAGNQGFDQKCAFLGDHRQEPPTSAAQESMVALLTALADRFGIDTSPGATTSFVSRGSNRHAAGATVTTATITGHRSMSATACPGDAAMALVETSFPASVQARRTPPATRTAMPGTTPPTTTTTTTTTTSTTTSTGAAALRPTSTSPSASTDRTPVGVVAAGAIAAVGGALLRWRSRTSAG